MCRRLWLVLVGDCDQVVLHSEQQSASGVSSSLLEWLPSESIQESVDADRLGLRAVTCPGVIRDESGGMSLHLVECLDFSGSVGICD